MKKIHCMQRAEERYSVDDFNYHKIIADIRNDRCEWIKSEQERESHTFLVRYYNKYMKVVTDINITFIKTVLPLNNDFDLINKLIQKLNTCDILVA